MIVKKEDAKTFDFDGLQITDYTADGSELSSFALIKVSENIRHQLSWSKRSDKYYYVIKGEIDFFIDGQTITLSDGDFCCIRKGTKFYYHNRSKEEVLLILVHSPNFDINEEVFE